MSDKGNMIIGPWSWLAFREGEVVKSKTYSMDDLMYRKVLEHVGHDIECVTYGSNALSVSLECVTCGMVLVDYDKPDSKEIVRHGK